MRGGAALKDAAKILVAALISDAISNVTFTLSAEMGLPPILCTLLAIMAGIAAGKLASDFLFSSSDADGFAKFLNDYSDDIDNILKKNNMSQEEFQKMLKTPYDDLLPSQKRIMNEIYGIKGGGSLNWDYLDELNFDKRYQMYLDNGLTPEEAKMLAGWDRPPSPEQYLANKEIYDNKLYFNKDTGAVIWPGVGPDANDVYHTNGFLNGQSQNQTMEPGMVLDRYGGADGTYLSPNGVPYEQRALAPFANPNDYHQYEVIRPFGVQAGTAAPWFGQPGGGAQYMTGLILDSNGNWVKATIQNLIDNKYIREL